LFLEARSRKNPQHYPNDTNDDSNLQMPFYA